MGTTLLGSPFFCINVPLFAHVNRDCGLQVPAYEEEAYCDMTRRNFSEGQTSSKLPIASAQDVEFSEELADEEDQEAQAREAAANRRVNEGE